MASNSALQAKVIAFPRPAANPAEIYLARLARSSRATMRSALRGIAVQLGQGPDPLGVDWARMSYAQVVMLRAVLNERYAPATANRALSALRGVLREAWRLGALDAETYHRAVDVPAVRGRAAPAGRALGDDELRLLLAACLGEHTPLGRRDAAIIALLAAAGLRRAELAALEVTDYDQASGAITVHEGKGRKGRVSYGRAARPYVNAWLAARGHEPGPLFLPARGRRGFARRHLSGEAVRLILRRRAAQAGLRECTPHDLRRTWVGRLLDAGADLATTQALAGHADPRTTAGYDRRGAETRERAAALVQLPTVGGTHGTHEG